jgi:N-acetylglucosaminyldiphosphoundecaprenol N-acetyl-beta-D-mannosaminyltransferase
MIKVNKKLKILNFYGIKFYNWEFKKILKRINSGGYLVAPAASALTQIHKDNIYYESIKKSDCAIFDSGFFCILLRLFGIYNATKLSGYLFLKKILKEKSIKKKKILLVNASILQEEKNKELMNINKFKNILCYKAPFYRSNKIVDLKIIDYIQKKKPFYIIINIGGGKQEPLALYIKKNIKFKISILCLGGAIDFITGTQAPINELIDKLYLGWFLRIIFNPKIFFLRVFNSLHLIFYFINRNYLARHH